MKMTTKSKRSMMTRVGISAGLCLALVLSLVLMPAAADAQKKDKAIGVGKAAGIGALLGLALGSNPLEGAAAGAAMGAAGGMIANSATQGKRDKEAAAASDEARKAAENEMKVSEQEARIATLQQELNDTVQARDEMQVAIVDAIGEDNWQGYKALRGCQYDRAYALAKAGATSSDPYHRLASNWLEAMTAVDQRSRDKADLAFQNLAEKDPDIDTVQQASLAADQAVLEMRGERSEIGIGPCS